MKRLIWLIGFVMILGGCSQNFWGGGDESIVVHCICEQPSEEPLPAPEPEPAPQPPGEEPPAEDPPVMGNGNGQEEEYPAAGEDEAGSEPEEDDADVLAPGTSQGEPDTDGDAPTEFASHTVVAGDTLMGIAQEFGLRAEVIQQWNNLEDMGQIFIGQVLQIPLNGNVTQTTPNPNLTETDMAQRVVAYILTGQGQVPEGDRLQWNESFLTQLNLEELYIHYLNGGNPRGDVVAFANFITEEAPIRPTWEIDIQLYMFRTHGTETTRFESLETGMYQAFTEENGIELPFAMVNPRTGHYEK